MPQLTTPAKGAIYLVMSWGVNTNISGDLCGPYFKHFTSAKAARAEARKWQKAIIIYGYQKFQRHYRLGKMSPEIQGGAVI